MDCQQLTQPAVALQILHDPADQRRQRLFGCIYELFFGSFLSWILKRYGHGWNKETLYENARDAFQTGLEFFHERAKAEGFCIRGSLKTTVYSFGLYQLMALFKTEKAAKRRSSPLERDVFFTDAFLEAERQAALNEEECRLIDAIYKLPPRMREMVVLKFFDKLRSKEIARQLAVTPGHVDNVMAKAFKILRRLLNETKAS